MCVQTLPALHTHKHTLHVTPSDTPVVQLDHQSAVIICLIVIVTLYSGLSLSLSHTHTALLAIVIPFLDDLISLLGAVASSSLALTFPALIDLFTHWHIKHQKFLYIFPRPVWICKNLFIILLGVLGCVCGTLASVYSIVEDFSKVNNGTAGVCD